MKLLTFLPSLALVATAASQSTSLSFTNQPSDVQIGMPVVIRYTAPAIDQPVQIILRKGERKNLDTVGKPLTSKTLLCCQVSNAHRVLRYCRRRFVPLDTLRISFLQ